MCSIGLVERVFHVLPQAQTTVHSTYSGWIPGFMSSSPLLRVHTSLPTRLSRTLQAKLVRRCSKRPTFLSPPATRRRPRPKTSPPERAPIPTCAISSPARSRASNHTTLQPESKGWRKAPHMFGARSNLQGMRRQLLPRKPKRQRSNSSPISVSQRS